MIGAPRIGASGAVQPFYNRGNAGPAAPPTFVNASASGVEDPARVSNPLIFAPPSFVIAAGDLLVVAVAQFGCLAGPSTPTVSVDGGGAPVSTLATSAASAASGVEVFLFYITGAAAGNRTVTVTAAGGIGTGPQTLMVAVYGLRGAAAAPLDKVASNSGLGSTGPFSVGPTPALSVPNQFDIAALAINFPDDTTEQPIPWVAPFVDRIHAGSIGGLPSDLTIWCADRTSVTTAAVTATSGAIADPTDFAIVVGTFKGA